MKIYFLPRLGTRTSNPLVNGVICVYVINETPTWLYIFGDFYTYLYQLNIKNPSNTNH